LLFGFLERNIPSNLILHFCDIIPQTFHYLIFW
jgi:hypothetical protein